MEEENRPSNRSVQDNLKAFFFLCQRFTEDDKQTKKRHIVFFYILYFARRLYTVGRGRGFSVKTFLSVVLLMAVRRL